jgi:hypothetical protein
MIGESSGVSTLINNERIYRENQAQSERGQEEKVAENLERTFSDITSFSPEALALSRNAVPPGESVELRQVESQGRGQGEGQKGMATSLDIRV